MTTRQLLDSESNIDLSRSSPCCMLYGGIRVEEAVDRATLKSSHVTSLNPQCCRLHYEHRQSVMD